MVQRRLLRRLLGVELMDQVVEVEGWSARVRRWELRLRLVVLLREELHRSVVVQKGEEQLVVQVQKEVVQGAVLQLVVLVQKEKAGVRRLVLLLLLRTVQVAMAVSEERLERRLLLAQKEKEPVKSEVEERRAVVMVPVVRQPALEMRQEMEEKRELLLKRRMLEKREEKRVLVMRQPMEEGMMRANRRAVKLAKAKTLEEKMPEERATVLLEKRHRARTRRSNRQR